jgi:hypothetical protein
MAILIFRDDAPVIFFAWQEPPMLERLPGLSWWQFPQW